MHGRAATALVAIMVATAPLQASAHANSAACSTHNSDIPSELAGWLSPNPIVAADNSANAQAAILPLNAAIDASLSLTSSVRYPATPQKPGKAESHGGLLQVTIETPGTYRVALSSAAWVDVINAQAPIPSTAHAHGPACSGIRKMVDFALEPGHYSLQIAGSENPTIKLMVVKVPD